MPEIISESITFILDASRSMFRSDYSPNRLEACKAAILHFIQTRKANEADMGGNSSFSLVLVRSTAKKVIEFDDSFQFDDFSTSLEEIPCGGKSALGDGIGLAIKMLIEDIRTNGARVPRIYLLSDGKYSQTKVDPLKMVSLAHQLGIQIHSVRLGEMEHFSVLKQISETTGGHFHFANSAAEILPFMASEAVGNIEGSGSDLAKRKEKVNQNVLKKIAAPLLTEAEMTKGSETQQGLIARLRGTKSYEKCSICFQPNDPISKTDFSISGRYCPNCATPMHNSCASMWAKNQNKDGDGTVFRCVHCLYLLKLPASVQTAVKMHQNMKKEMQSDAGTSQGRIANVSVALARDLGEAALYSACPVCNGIFEETEQVIRCGNSLCNAIYHARCFSKLPNQVCKSCGFKLVRTF